MTPSLIEVQSFT